MFSGRFDVKAKHQRTTKPLIDLTRGEQRNMKANKDAGNDNRRLMRQAAQTLAAEQVGLIGKAETRIRQMSVMELDRVSVFISGSWVQKILSPRCAFEYKYDAATIVLPIKSWACPSFCAALSTFHEKQKLDFLLSSVCCRSNSEGRCSNCLGADRGSGGSRPA
jgi:hypothetical protein